MDNLGKFLSAWTNGEDLNKELEEIIKTIDCLSENELEVVQLVYEERVEKDAEKL